MSDIKCMCEECTYNEEKKCGADSIEVKSNGDRKVESSTQTRCSTFEPRTTKM